jgi:hypothetical protein
MMVNQQIEKSVGYSSQTLLRVHNLNKVFW